MGLEKEEDGRKVPCCSDGWRECAIRARSWCSRSRAHEGFIDKVEKVNSRASRVNVLLGRAWYNQNREQTSAGTSSMVWVELTQPNDFAVEQSDAQNLKAAVDLS